jgi:NADH-quinone oxidoreductase subunit C
VLKRHLAREEFVSKFALEKLRQRLGADLLSTHDYRGDETAVINADKLRETCQWLREEPELQFDMLTDLTAVDYYEQRRRPRFEIVYHFYSVAHRHRLRLKIGTDHPDSGVDTVSDIWRNANWLEREVWDLYGITFRQHPDLRRILLYEQFEGHPLRKDYPKQKRQPLSRRPQKEIDRALGKRPEAKRSLL